MTYDPARPNHLIHDGLGDPDTCVCEANHPRDLEPDPVPWWRHTYHRRTVRRALVALAAILTLLVAGIGYAAGAKADVPVQCVTNSGFWLFHGTQRTLCDGPLLPDGSWHRWREFWTPAHNVPLSCYSSGGYYSSYTTCSGGYWQPQTSNGVEDYPVFPSTVLQDEPGHIA